MDVRCPHCNTMLFCAYEGAHDIPNGAGSFRAKGGHVIRCSEDNCPDWSGACDTEAEAWRYALEAIKEVPKLKGE